jgi:hypothetical protein
LQQQFIVIDSDRFRWRGCFEKGAELDESFKIASALRAENVVSQQTYDRTFVVKSTFSFDDMKRSRRDTTGLPTKRAERMHFVDRKMSVTGRTFLSRTDAD